jgi:hypothetical protein
MHTRTRHARRLLAGALATLLLLGCGKATTLLGLAAATPAAALTPAILASQELKPTVVTRCPPTPSPPQPQELPDAAEDVATANIHTAPAQQIYDDRRGPIHVLASYWNAVNVQDFARAWAYWERPPSATYDDFVRGFADTPSVLLAVRPAIQIEGAAGSLYASVPALLSAVHKDGSRHNFVGCFVARCPNVDGEDAGQQWSLHGATVRRTADNSMAITLLNQACPVPRRPLLIDTGKQP